MSGLGRPKPKPQAPAVEGSAASADQGAKTPQPNTSMEVGAQAAPVHGEGEGLGLVAPEAGKPILGWDEAWERTKGPIEAKMNEIREALRAEGVATDTVGLYEGDDGSGFALSIGIPTSESKDCVPIALTGMLQDAAYDDGEPGDYWVGFEAIGPGGLALGRYAPGMYTQSAYVQTTEALLERIQELDVAQSVAYLIKEGEKQGWQLRDPGAPANNLAAIRRVMMGCLKETTPRLEVYHVGDGEGFITPEDHNMRPRSGWSPTADGGFSMVAKSKAEHLETAGLPLPVEVKLEVRKNRDAVDTRALDIARGNARWDEMVEFIATHLGHAHYNPAETASFSDVMSDLYAATHSGGEHAQEVGEGLREHFDECESEASLEADEESFDLGIHCVAEEVKPGEWAVSIHSRVDIGETFMFSSQPERDHRVGPEFLIPVLPGETVGSLTEKTREAFRKAADWLTGQGSAGVISSMPWPPPADWRLTESKDFLETLGTFGRVEGVVPVVRLRENIGGRTKWEVRNALGEAAKGPGTLLTPSEVQTGFLLPLWRSWHPGGPENMLHNTAQKASLQKLMALCSEANGKGIPVDVSFAE